MTNAIAALTFYLAFSAPERTAVQYALGAIESGNNDKAIGKKSERSRYQILPSVWRENCPYRLSEATNPVYSWICCTNILDRRVVSFHRVMNRRPGWIELYALYNSPAWMAHNGYRKKLMHRALREKGERFAALVESELKTKKP